NLNLHEQGRGNRGGTAHVLATAYPHTIMGIHDFTLVGGTQSIVVATKDGELYEAVYVDGSTNKISDETLSTSNYYDFEVFEDELYIVDGNTTPRIWTGGSGDTTEITGASDWGAAEGPQWIVKHGRGASERLWAGGCEDTPGTVYISPDGGLNYESDEPSCAVQSDQYSDCP
ncbi:unnamed protein product, partial [marine sediment metagenome]